MTNKKRIRTQSGFTLLEIIIVIIIVGILATLAMPKYFSTVEYSRSVEAMISLSAIRQSMERCYLQTRTYVGCDDFTRLDLEDPGLSPGAHFSYTIANPTAIGYDIIATRNLYENGNGLDQIMLSLNGMNITRSGTGAFLGIK
jgi:prepilin-type N-terminal cleavage/methylation domain-containing protein